MKSETRLDIHEAAIITILQRVTDIFEQPYCKISFVERAGIAKRLTATKYLRDLEKAGIRQKRPMQKSPRLIFKGAELASICAD